MKKFLAILLAAMLLLSMGAVAVAEDEAQNLFTKKLKITNNGTTIGDTEFTFKAKFNNYKADSNEGTLEETGDGVGAPSVTLGSVTLSSSTLSEDVTISHGDFPKVGIYTYDVTENETNFGGIANYTGEMKLVITVTNGENGLEETYAFYTDSSTKGKEIENTYNAGSLLVSKTVDGKLGDKSNYFEFKVKLTGEKGKSYADSFNVSGGTYDSNPTTISLNTETSFYLKHDETITISNVPYGVSYTVTEVKGNEDGYSTTVNGTSGKETINAINAASTTVAFKNTKGDSFSPDTGITTDSLPYVMLLGFVLLAGAAIIIKRRLAH